MALPDLDGSRSDQIMPLMLGRYSSGMVDGSCDGGGLGCLYVHPGFAVAGLVFDVDARPVSPLLAACRRLLAEQVRVGPNGSW